MCFEAIFFASLKSASMPRFFKQAQQVHLTPKKSKDWKYCKRKPKQKPASKDTRLAKYNITKKELAQRTRKQKGQCAICQKATKLVVDHCHETGGFRELLCFACNSMLGFAKDDPTILEKGANYLEKWHKRLNNSRPYRRAEKGA